MRAWLHVLVTTFKEAFVMAQHKQYTPLQKLTAKALTVWRTCATMRVNTEDDELTSLLLRKAEAAAALGISIRQLELYVRRGDITVHRLGRRCVRIDRAELDRFVERLPR
jgi:excisionase family DNA binding protein